VHVISSSCGMHGLHLLLRLALFLTTQPNI
jgi:hypothetical protein